jgi:hypothetical protein
MRQGRYRRERHRFDFERPGDLTASTWRWHLRNTVDSTQESSLAGKFSEKSRRTAAKQGDAEEARFAPANRRRLSGPGLRAFFAIADRWGLSAAERRRVLGSPARTTYYRWRARARAKNDLTLPAAVLLRISAVLALYRCLAVLFDATEAVNWLREPHGAPVFGSQPPLALVTSGTLENLLIVHHYVAALCAGIGPAPGPGELDLPPLTADDIEIV